MRMRLRIFILCTLLFFGFTTISQDLPAQAGLPVLPAAQAASLLEVPSIGLEAPIVEVGINSKGEMGVPDGRTNSVGWYKYGTPIGERGSAVVDAHVYAAFKNLKFAKVGDKILVGEKTFEITKTEYYKLENMPMVDIFTRADTSRLNLITCAGSWDASRGTYTHRLVVYTERLD